MAQQNIPISERLVDSNLKINAMFGELYAAVAADAIKTAYESNPDTNGFTDLLLAKLNGVEDAATADQTGAEIAGLLDAEPNRNPYTDAEKAKLAGIDAAHYGAPLQSTAELTALPEASLTDKERRYVEDELSDYFYDATATSGAFAPNDQTGGTGFWRQVAVGGETAASIKTKYESNPDTNAFTDAEQTKLAGVESGATANGAATEAAPGVAEQATQAEVEAGTAGNLFATVARLKAELDRRTSQIAAIDNGPQIWSNITVGSNVILSADLRGLGGVPTDAKGVYVNFVAGAQTSLSQVGISSADVTPSGNLRVIGQTGNPNSITVPVPLGTGANAGKIAVVVFAGSNCTGFNAWVSGWWR